MGGRLDGGGGGEKVERGGGNAWGRGRERWRMGGEKDELPPPPGWAGVNENGPSFIPRNESAQDESEGYSSMIFLIYIANLIIKPKKRGIFTLIFSSYSLLGYHVFSDFVSFFS
jgi:hypothetical protein